MEQSSLFSADAPPPALIRGPFASVALERSFDRVLDYAIPASMKPALRVGQRVRVPLGKGNRPRHGYVVAISDTSPLTQRKPSAIKRVLGIDDERVLLTPSLLELSRWMSRYYCAALGTVLESVIPSAVKKKIGLAYTPVVRLAISPADAQELIEKTRPQKRRAILARLMQLEPGQGIGLHRLAAEAGAKPPTVRKLVRAGILTLTPEPDFDALTPPPPAVEAAIAIPELNADQSRAIEQLLPRIDAGGFSSNLLLGVTGSGKTEVYLRCIDRIVQQGRQAIVLVPEIALTPQTVRRFTARFARVAVLHSGLGASQRHRFWQQIWTGAADVVVGARSAVFAPVPRLGMIVVDEEHEASYKQDTAPRYNARDVAIKRAQLEGVTVLLGSATPSLESYWRAGGPNALSAIRQDAPGTQRLPGSQAHAMTGESVPHHATTPPGEPPPVPTPAKAPPILLSLPNRVRGLAMPAVELVDMKIQAKMRRGIHLLSARFEHLLQIALQQNQQAIVLLNRRGYSNFVYCASCAEAIKCKYCDATMTYHRTAGLGGVGGRTARGVHTGQLHCHYCLAVNSLPEKCPACGKTLSLFGLGTQRVEEEIAAKFPDLKFVRVDGDTMRNSRDYEDVLCRFANREIQVMLGTQMIAKGLDFPNVTLVGVISGDTALSLPDFRASERTFQLITQVAGRAGRGDAPGRVVLQTFMPHDPTIQAALRQDYAGFARAELSQRREVGLPPFARMARVIYRDQELDKVHSLGEKLATMLSQNVTAENGAVMLKGPMPCAITRIAGYHRGQIVLSSPSAAALQRVLAATRKEGGFAESGRVAVDVDPVSLL